MRTDAQVYDLAAAGVWPGGALGTPLSATGAATPIRGGEYVFAAEGTVGGSTVSLQVQLPGSGTWCDVGALAGNAVVKTTTLPYTASQVYLPACNVRCAITGGSGVSVNAELIGIG